LITISTAAQSTVQRTFRYYLAAESWRAGTLLASDIPITTATEETDRTIRVPERVTLTVPRTDRGTSWSPIGDDHPLAANGQTLRIKLGIGLALNTVEWFQRGVFLIHDSGADGDVVTVNAVGLLQWVEEARLISPFQPTGTLVSTLRGLIEPALTVQVDAALVDRAVPSAINFDEDRLGAVTELLDAWPADAYVDPGGFLRVQSAAQSTTSLLSLTSGAGGTVIQATGSSTRDGAFNAVVARGTASDGGQVQGWAYDLSGGPKAYGGPFNALPVPQFFASPLLTTVAQCNAAAETRLARLKRGAGRLFTVTMIPNPAIQVGDVLTITTSDYTSLLVSVESLRLPYLPGGGAMTLTVRAVV
jgi:hypothetical protein